MKAQPMAVKKDYRRVVKLDSSMVSLKVELKVGEREYVWVG
jgi:hypothetical protein